MTTSLPRRDRDDRRRSTRAPARSGTRSHQRTSPTSSPAAQGAARGVTPGHGPDHVPMSHRGGLPGPRPAVVTGGAGSAVLTVAAPVAFVLLLLAAPGGPVRDVVLVVAWLALAVAVELRDRRRRRPTGRETASVSAGTGARVRQRPGQGHDDHRSLQGVLDR